MPRTIKVCGMEIYDDPNRVYPIRPAPPAHDRRYRKSPAGKELFLVSGTLFLFLGGMVLLIALSECLIAPTQTTLCLVASCLPLFVAGGLGIRYRHYPHMAKVCFAVSLLAGASCILWLFAEAYRLPGAIGLMTTATYGFAWSIGHR
ncbi:MAG: hypothetical protein PHO41_10150 [Eubacteriales bacterium]|nr:hypothetical protein [Eubacteriales bacterium]